MAVLSLNELRGKMPIRVSVRFRDMRPIWMSEILLIKAHKLEGK